MDILHIFRRCPVATRGARTYEDAVKYAEEALAGYLDALVAHGDHIPEETETTASVSLGITVRTPVIV